VRPAEENVAERKYFVRRAAECPTDVSICGTRQRLITSADTPLNSFSRVQISDAQAHYHEHTTEFYYVLEGTGFIQLDGETIALSQGDMVMIQPGVKHRAYGNITALVVGNPPFTTDDQFEADM